MSIALMNRVAELERKVAEQAKALEAKAGNAVHEVEHATKDDLDAFLARLRKLEGDVAAMVKRKI